MLTLLAGLVAYGTWADDLTLDQAVQAALDHGPDNAVAAGNLLAAKAADAQAQAAAGLTASASLGYLAAKAVNSTPKNTALTTAISPLAVTTDNAQPQQALGSLTVGTPMTKLVTSGTENFATASDGSLLTQTIVAPTLTQTLLTGYWGGAAQAAADKSALGYQSAVFTAQLNRNAAVLKVKNAYFALLSAQDQVDVNTQTLGQRQDALKFTQAKAAGGTTTAYAVKVAQAAVQTALLNLVASQNALVTAQATLASLVGSPVGTLPRALPVDLPPPAATADEAVTAALRNRPELQTAILAVRMAGVDVAAASGAAIPTVVLTAGVSYNTSNTVLPSATTTSWAMTGNVGVTVVPPSIDGGQADNKVLQTRTLQSVAQTQADLLLQTIPTAVRDAWAAWQLGGQRLALNATLVDNADVNRQILKAQFDSGVTTIDNWLTAEVGYSSAQLAVVTARQSYQQSAATLLNLMGQ